MNLAEILKYAKATKFAKYKIKGLVKLDGHKDVSGHKGVSRHKNINRYEDTNGHKDVDTIKNENVISNGNMISNGNGILRPCLMKAIKLKNPPHWVRVASTIDLMKKGLSSGQILKLYSRFDWIDYNFQITKYQVMGIVSNGYNSYSCERIKALGLCKEGCKWNMTSS